MGASGTQCTLERVRPTRSRSMPPRWGRASVAIQRCVEPDVESITQWPEFRDDRPPFRWVPVVPTSPFPRASACPPRSCTPPTRRRRDSPYQLQFSVFLIYTIFCVADTVDDSITADLRKRSTDEAPKSPRPPFESRGVAESRSETIETTRKGVNTRIGVFACLTW